LGLFIGKWIIDCVKFR